MPQVAGRSYEGIRTAWKAGRVSGEEIWYRTWRADDVRLEKWDAENRANVGRTRRSRGKEREANAGVVGGKGGGCRGGRLSVALAQTFTFFTSSPLSRRFLKSAMAVPARGWLIFVRSPRSLGLSLLLEHSLSDSLRVLFFSLLPPHPTPVSSFSLSGPRDPSCSFAEDPLSPFLALSPLGPAIPPSSNPLDTSGHGRSPYVTDTIPLE